MDRYFYFDIDEFFRSYEENKIRLAEIKTEINYIAESMGIDYESPKVSGGLPSSTVETKAEAIEKLEEEKKELEWYFDKCEEMIGKLDEEEEKIARSYFLNNNKSRANMEKLSYDLNYSVATIYRKLKAIRKKMVK